MFRTSYRKYILLQITESSGGNVKFKCTACRIVQPQPSSSQSSSRRTMQSTEKKLRRRRKRDRARRHAETAKRRLSKRRTQGHGQVILIAERPGCRSCEIDVLLRCQSRETEHAAMQEQQSRRLSKCRTQAMIKHRACFTCNSVFMHSREAWLQ